MHANTNVIKAKEKFSYHKKELYKKNAKHDYMQELVCVCCNKQMEDSCGKSAPSYCTRYCGCISQLR